MVEKAAAGARPIAREAVTLALDWAESVEDFRRVLTAYAVSSGTTLPKEAWIFGGWVEALSGWLTYDVEQRADSYSAASILKRAAEGSGGTA